MKRALSLLLLLVVAVAWWATSSRKSNAPAADAPAAVNEPAPYPADFDERLARVAGLRLSLGKPLPPAIPWQNATGHPAVGDAAARPGGRVRLCNAGPFPAHFHRFGGGEAQFFHQNLLAATEIPLVARHPLTGQPTAGVAEAWAVVGRTVHFRLNPAARYNNGRPVRAGDYLLAALLQAEQRCAEYEQLAEAAEALCAHNETHLSITLRSEADAVRAARLLMPAEPAFHSGFDSRYREQFAQRIPPATGPYRVSRVEHGRRIELQRPATWWGESLPLCRHRFNVLALEYHFLNSEAQVWEFLLRGKLDALQTRNITAWQEHAEPASHLHRTVYDAEYPLPPYGIALNTRTLPRLELRRGLLHAMDMDRAVALMTRGEGQRLRTFHSGYGPRTPQETPQYRYDPETARRYFAQAGYTTAGSDGILKRADGTRLSVRLTYTPHEKISALLTCIIRSAADCGAEIVPEPLPWQHCQRRLQERSHELCFWAVPAAEEPSPALFFSPQAAPEYSPFGLNSPEMNAALTEFEQTGNLSAVDAQVCRHAIWLPGWKENRVYLAHNPRLRIPPSPWCFDALDAHLFWFEPAP